MDIANFRVPSGPILFVLFGVSISGCTLGSAEDPAAAQPGSLALKTDEAPPSTELTDNGFAEKSLQAALENSVSGKSLVWNNPASGARGSITPLKTWKNAQGAYCRSYSEWIRQASGKSVRRRGTACRSKNAVWTAA